ncbi:alpha/beta hydrolase family esterase [Planctomycetota bacterium]
MKKRQVAWILIGLVGLCLGGCQTSGPGKSLTRKTDIRLKGLRRNYRMYIPQSYRADRAMPLVVVIHGAFSTAKKVEAETGFSRLAEEQGFLVAYPNGFGLFGFLQHWNAGHCCGKAKKDGIDDVGFLATVIDDIKQWTAVDASRIYMVGFSNGGMLVHRFAVERSDTVAAVAALAASIGGREEKEEQVWRIPVPKQPVPMLIMHGDADDSVPFAGGESGRHDGQYYLSVEETTGFWRKHNGCHPEAQRLTTHQGHLEIQTWPALHGQSDTVLYRLKDWSHQWPGLTYTAKLPSEDGLRDFDGTRIIWEFFADKRRSD